MGVTEKYAPIRRHAIGVAAVAVLSLGAWGGVIVALQGGQGAADASRVQSDLSALIDSHGASGSAISCTHQQGNVWECAVTLNGQQQWATVTDDGHNIIEQGLQLP